MSDTPRIEIEWLPRAMKVYQSSGLGHWHDIEVHKMNAHWMREYEKLEHELAALSLQTDDRCNVEQCDWAHARWKDAEELAEKAEAELTVMRKFEDDVERVVAMHLSVEDCDNPNLTTTERVLNAVKAMKADPSGSETKNGGT